MASRRAVLTVLALCALEARAAPNRTLYGPPKLKEFTVRGMEVDGSTVVDSRPITDRQDGEKHFAVADWYEPPWWMRKARPPCSGLNVFGGSKLITKCDRGVTTWSSPGQTAPMNEKDAVNRMNDPAMSYANGLLPNDMGWKDAKDYDGTSISPRPLVYKDPMVMYDQPQHGVNQASGLYQHYIPQQQFVPSSANIGFALLHKYDNQNGLGGNMNWQGEQADLLSRDLSMGRDVSGRNQHNSWTSEEHNIDPTIGSQGKSKPSEPSLYGPDTPLENIK